MYKRQDRILSDHVALPSDTDDFPLQCNAYGNRGGMDRDVLRLGRTSHYLYEKVCKQKMAELFGNWETTNELKRRRCKIDERLSLDFSLLFGRYNLSYVRPMRKFTRHPCYGL